MSCFFSKVSPEDREKAKRSREIDAQITRDGKTAKGETKLLLLGPGESGKSTVFKQMKIIQVNGGYSREELLAFRFIVYGNCITQMKVLINATKKLALPLKEGNAERADRVAKLPTSSDSWEPELNLKDIQMLWADEGIKKTYERRDIDFQLNDSAEYFFDNIARFLEPNYCPTEQDVLRARVRTTGIDEAVFTFDELTCRMMDVGGQRTERRKWIHCFDSVTSVLFCSSLSEYNQKLREDSSQNRMRESLLLFSEICNSTWFKNTAIMLFLNKTDLFKEKIAQVDLKCCFPEYDGGCNFERASEFIKERFLAQNTSPERTIYVHFTCAVDTENIIFVFNCVKETLLNKVLNTLGF